MKQELFIARRYLKQKKGGMYSLISIVAIGGVFIGVAAIIIVMSVLNGFHEELKRRILGINPHIIVQKFYNVPITEEEYRNVVNKITNTVGGEIMRMAPVIFGKTVIKSNRGAEGVMFTGIEPEAEKDISDLFKDVIIGEYDLSGDGILIGTDLANILGVTVGEKVSAVSPAGGGISIMAFPRVYKFTVKGIFDAGLYDYNATMVFLNIENARRLAGIGRGVTGVKVSLKNIYKAQKIGSKLQKAIGYPYRVVDWITMNKNIFAALKLEKTVVFIVMTLIVLVAAFNIIGMLVMTVNGKTKEIGILKAMGASSKDIMRIFTYFGLLIGLIGTFGGAVFGIIISFLLNKLKIIELPSSVYFIRTLPVQIRWQDILLTVFVAIIIIYGATVYPARKASKLNPVDAIRYE